MILSIQLLDVAAINLVKGEAPYTAAHLTASRGHNEALHVLLACISNLDIRDVNGKW